MHSETPAARVPEAADDPREDDPAGVHGEKVTDAPPVDVKSAFNNVCTAHLGRRMGSV